MPAGRPKENPYIKHKIAEKLPQIENWCRNGFTDVEIAKKLHIGKTLFYRIKKENPELKELLKKDKDYADDQVENAAFKRAMGFEYEETTTEVKMGQDGIAIPTVVKKTKKLVPGDTTAQIFWLKNRRPEKWRDKQEVEHSGTNPFIEALMNIGKRTPNGET